ncbi:hypothetical protein PSN45_000629 [Yamadazyma tenuis]|uniref:Uncharacterized protein n=1 Tax=Candida tenuis (strain ATCC 10573 / BCRC 21748 / CBS 615 / JCM 9827 / NBRC 10315 / NRRL Y-1498 / VKM Y-70) TaxID=590646 RepID=G3B9N4_CANTC|nr:uncharacterized protein CANTEDRAFT_135858 [Yamadazyma tenuis ATCC 10573]EGV61933.1 hypothetical protein CANTEDRAFT_135858 [Yamadazyma tenuis ATCC 10573]WEJ93168.1 hypothetical protein PSN45_000629 [Yamadazyma tenuis]
MYNPYPSYPVAQQDRKNVNVNAVNMNAMGAINSISGSSPKLYNGNGMVTNMPPSSTVASNASMSGMGHMVQPAVGGPSSSGAASGATSTTRNYSNYPQPQNTRIISNPPVTASVTGHHLGMPPRNYYQQQQQQSPQTQTASQQPQMNYQQQQQQQQMSQYQNQNRQYPASTIYDANFLQMYPQQQYQQQQQQYQQLLQVQYPNQYGSQFNQQQMQHMPQQIRNSPQQPQQPQQLQSHPQHQSQTRYLEQLKQQAAPQTYSMQSIGYEDDHHLDGYHQDLDLKPRQQPQVQLVQTQTQPQLPGTQQHLSHQHLQQQQNHLQQQQNSFQQHLQQQPLHQQVQPSHLQVHGQQQHHQTQPQAVTHDQYLHKSPQQLSNGPSKLSKHISPVGVESVSSKITSASGSTPPTSASSGAVAGPDQPIRKRGRKPKNQSLEATNPTFHQFDNPPPVPAEKRKRGRPKLLILDPTLNSYIDSSHPNYKALRTQMKREDGPVLSSYVDKSQSAYLLREYDASEASKLLQKKDKRGRPRKFAVEETGITVKGVRIGGMKHKRKKSVTNPVPNQMKRPRGRPRKIDTGF